MYPVNVRPRFADDIVVGMGCLPRVGGDMLSTENMLSGLGSVFSRKAKKAKKKLKKLKKKYKALQAKYAATQEPAAEEYPPAAAPYPYPPAAAAYAPEGYAPQAYPPAPMPMPAAYPQGGYPAYGGGIAPMPATFEEPAMEQAEEAPVAAQAVEGEAAESDVVSPDEVEGAAAMDGLGILSDDVVPVAEAGVSEFYGLGFSFGKKLKKRFKKLHRKAVGTVKKAHSLTPEGMLLSKLRKKRKKKVKRIKVKAKSVQAVEAARDELFQSQVEALKSEADAAGYPYDKLATLIQGRGLERARKTLRKLAALKAKQDIAQYTESLTAVQAGQPMPPVADAVASAATGLEPDTVMAQAMMPASSYAQQQYGLPAYAQQSVEAAAQATVSPYSMPLVSAPAYAQAQIPYQQAVEGDVVPAPAAPDEDIVSPADVEGAVIDTAAQPRTGIPSSELTSEDLIEQTPSASDEEVVSVAMEDADVIGPSGSMEGEGVTPGLPSMDDAGTARDIRSLVRERAGSEEPMSVELSRKRYPSMLVEEEQVGWPFKVGEGADTAGGWYGTDPAIEEADNIEGAGSPRSMRQRMRQLEAEATQKLEMGRDIEEGVPMVADESEAEEGVSLRERMRQGAAREARALTRYVVEKRRRGGMSGLGATPFAAQWAVQNAINAIDSREKQLMAADPARLQALRGLNASAVKDIADSRAILEGPSAPIADELAAVTKFTAAAASYKAALDGAIQALRPRPIAKPKAAAPKSAPQVFVQEVKQRAMSPLGIAGLVAAGLGVGYLAFRAFSRK